ncbi:hypothetical protein cypCar_00006964 [Cyprinus carpio]|nr:hypothetical protein cypCar_00006964 [Cyprinus carpio]
MQQIQGEMQSLCRRRTTKAAEVDPENKGGDAKAWSCKNSSLKKQNLSGQKILNLKIIWCNLETDIKLCRQNPFSSSLLVTRSYVEMETTSVAHAESSPNLREKN